MRVSSAPYNVHGTVAVVSADNPAGNSLGGFKESASAFRNCRQCLGIIDETAQVSFDCFVTHNSDRIAMNFAIN